MLPYSMSYSFKSLFEELGFKVYWSYNLIDMELFIEKEKIDIGLEWQWVDNDHTILNLVKKHKKNIHVILCLNWNGKIPSNFKELGYSDYLNVPFIIEEVQGKFYEILNRSKIKN